MDDYYDSQRAYRKFWALKDEVDEVRDELRAGRKLGGNVDADTREALLSKANALMERVESHVSMIIERPGVEDHTEQVYAALPRTFSESIVR